MGWKVPDVSCAPERELAAESSSVNVTLEKEWKLPTPPRNSKVAPAGSTTMNARSPGNALLAVSFQLFRVTVTLEIVPVSPDTVICEG